MRVATFIFAAIVAVGAAEAATDYPTRAITMVVPFAAGGPTDTVARLTAEAMAKDLGQSIVVENVAGAGGTLASRRVAQAKPDGYTILIHHIGISTAPSLYRQLPFKTTEAFAPIGLVTDAPMTIIARSDFPANTLSELIAYIKEKKEAVTYANSGLGAASHLCGMLFMSTIGVQMTTVPYKGNGPIMTDLMGKQVDLTCDQTTNTAGPIKAGNVKAYAVTTPTRVQELPDVPTAAEAGLPGFELGVWHGLYAPAGTPPEVISKLVAALQKAVEDDNVKKRFNEIATEPVTRDRATPEQLGQKLTSEIARWAPIIKAAGQFAD
jgi:tripartite-type tricarboxylate transporter receptor subunit TctC